MGPLCVLYIMLRLGILWVMTENYEHPLNFNFLAQYRRDDFDYGQLYQPHVDDQCVGYFGFDTGVHIFSHHTIIVEFYSSLQSIPKHGQHMSTTFLYA